MCFLFIGVFLHIHKLFLVRKCRLDMFMEQLHGTSGEERSLFSPFEVDVGDVDLPLLALAGDLPGHVGQDGEHEEGGVDE